MKKSELESALEHPIFSRFSGPELKKGKIVSAMDAVKLIRDGDTIATDGFVGTGFPEEIAIELETYFLSEGKPRNLTIVTAAGQGDGKGKGLNRLAHAGLVNRVISAHIGLAPRIQDLIRENKVLGYNLPQGVITHLFRDIAGGRPGEITKVGLGTFIDPRIDGGKLNKLTTEQGGDLVRLIEIEGEEYLFYKTFPINVAMLRGTTADTDGNITMEKEPLSLEVLSLAMAAKNSGGFVIVQVERIAERNTLSSRTVKIPGIMVDCVVVAKQENHWQTYTEFYNPAFCGETRMPVKSISRMEMGIRKIISRRAAFELSPNSVVNLGIGMPEGVARIANEEGIVDCLTMTAEPGVIGGVPNDGLNFGTAINADCVIDQPYQFDFYDGGGLDAAFLGAAEVDAEGNVNVSRFGSRFVGPGGFINISQNSKKIVFMGTFTAGGLEVCIENGRIRITSEGRDKKFLKRVGQKTFSGRHAALRKMTVLYITERCVFRLVDEGLELIEIAPGINLETDIIAKMEFLPIIRHLVFMDPRIFNPDVMNIRSDLLDIPIEDRLVYNPEENIFFVNFENFYIRSRGQIEKIRAQVEETLSPLHKKVSTIVNYDNFNIDPELVGEYTDMVKDVMKFYRGITRYTTSTFIRMKLGDELQKRKLAPHIYESKEEARKRLVAQNDRD